MVPQEIKFGALYSELVLEDWSSTERLQLGRGGGLCLAMWERVRRWDGPVMWWPPCSFVSWHWVVFVLWWACVKLLALCLFCGVDGDSRIAEPPWLNSWIFFRFFVRDGLPWIFRFTGMVDTTALDSLIDDKSTCHSFQNQKRVRVQDTIFQCESHGKYFRERKW